ncbi:MAG: transposase family protein, partial [Myxococcota bacterium]
MLRAAYVPLCEEEARELEQERQADRERTFLSWTAGVKDPRQAGKVLYPLDAILLVALCSILCREEGTCATMHAFGTLALPVLRRV